jgi:hypothetical protein
MTFAFNRLLLLALAVAGAPCVAGPVTPMLPCDAPVYVFGGATISAAGVRMPGNTDMASRMKSFFSRICRTEIAFQTIANGRGTLADAQDRIRDTVSRSPNSIAFVHFPFADIEAGTPVDQVLQI